MSRLEVRNLTVAYGRRAAPALVDVSLTVGTGERLALVGESGSGKSTLLRAVAGLVPIRSGAVHLDDVELTHLSRARLRPHRRRFQMVFQDPYASLNPRLTAHQIVAEPLRVHEPGLTARGRRERAEQLLDEVGLAAGIAERYPHELSGGQRQRLGIARALSIRPELLLLDEPVSALDVSVQAQVLNLLLDLAERRGLGWIFVSHDLAVVGRVSTRIAVLLGGRLVEVGSRDRVLGDPLHPYTRRLRDAVPVPDPARQRARFAAFVDDREGGGAGEGSGCVFANRCPLVEERCRREEPTLEPRAEGAVACHLT